MPHKPPMSELVKDPLWQKTREELLGQWTVNPEECCRKIRRYLGPISSTTNDKIKIVMNYLTSTGFRTGRIKHDCITKIRHELSMEILKRKAKKSWDR